MDDSLRPVLRNVLSESPGGIVGAYLYGSSTTTGLGPESDIDLLLVTRESLTIRERRSLIALLLEHSGWEGHAQTFPEVADQRPLEVTSLVADSIDPLVAAPWCDFQFGEWLREDFVDGYVPEPERNPDMVLLLATALASHQVLHGPRLEELVAKVPFTLLKEAQLATVPALFEELHSDSRNVLLTLARALITIETGVIVSKTRAAEMAVKYLDPADAELLHAAAREYKGEIRVAWGRESESVSAAANSLYGSICLAASKH